MSAGIIGGAANIGAAQTQNQSSIERASNTNKFAELDSTEFIKILVQELTTQDPLKPNDSSKILEQLSSLRNIESQTQLQEQLKSLVSQNEIAQASGMIGKMVQGLTETGDRISGLVTSVRVKDNEAILELDTGKQLPMSRLERVTNSNSGTETAAGMTG